MTYIAPRAKALRHMDRLAGWQAGQQPAPVTVEWDLTNVCSLACQGCHFAYTHVAGPWASRAPVKPHGYQDTGKVADVALVTRGLAQMAACGVQAIVWSGGGEPTLHPDFAYIVQEAYRLGLAQGLYTLGGHLHPLTASALAHTLQWVVVSLDAADEGSYAAEKGVDRARFADACRGLAALAGGSATVGVSFLLHAGNWTQTEAMLAKARALGATYATFRPLIETSPDAPGVVTASRRWVDRALPCLQGLSDEPDVEIDVDRFVAYRDWQGHGYASCAGVSLVTSITPDGQVWACPNRRGVAGSAIGDLRVESFAALWARHPGRWTVDAGCRAMCRLHLVNQALVPVVTPRAHEAFV